MAIIGRYIESLDDDALRRVLDRPIEGWCRGEFGHPDSRACLVTTALGFRPSKLEETAMDVACRFDTLTATHEHRKLPRLVRAIKIRALKVLESRHPLKAHVHC